MSYGELDEIQWKNPEWINQFGLNTGNVLDYFSESPFYDRTSNNQVFKMQFQFQPPPPNLNTPLEYTKYFESKLSDMVGIEFVIAYIREPDFWIIRKQNRFSRDNVQILQSYYIIGANIYQSPKLYRLISSRLLNSTYSIKTAINLLNNLNEFKHDDDKADTSSNGNSTTQTPFTPAVTQPKKEINFDSILDDALNHSR
ncbi:Mediator of RNA polymerase II transcription subunit 6 [Yamadazyma tenuis]|uniref:Mediator of RNA polymerase II transcription subunit 6 n=1 Tax=Candida tenuis (strain ATCC 10573 / BCRC 21748 / CBS 615 / JCM 9827 / NBRC 10315 / NRRL Y-1498 / VKM Y-70) TaxID=590646 RepID=G3B450_CANTC|nr:MED6-domain-containing protein [Yamadazyma tenuis ATCC 10573]EGV63777.1 MED6-domain-containing protein [Yamadazyma tenuis ATCC 10573]WEJ96611.1 Mediator of RNA polymerase II transcription subunit 6 [Yamadazyma tenuis]